MNKSKLIKISLIQALAAALYVSGIAFLMSSAEKLFSGSPEIFAGIAMLLLFVISASVMGYLVLGRSLMMYMDGAKKEAVRLFGLTISWMVIIAAAVFIGLAIFK